MHWHRSSIPERARAIPVRQEEKKEILYGLFHYLCRKHNIFFLLRVLEIILLFRSLRT